jgi:nicotinate-nucleotide adenylyltransferase
MIRTKTTKTTDYTERIGVMGGTFDPIHYGHLAAAEAARARFALSRVLFIPAGQPPHKNGAFLTAANHRYCMTQLAIANDRFFFASRLEIDRQNFSFTVDTLRELRAVYGADTKLYMIIGADTLKEMPTWRDPARVFSLCECVAVTRASYDRLAMECRSNDLVKQYGAKIHLLEMHNLEISSTDIRQKLLAGKSVKFLLPDLVERYIRKHHLYTQYDEWDVYQLERQIERQLSDKRFRHTIGVCETAVSLADRYETNRQSAYVAALLHDCAKELPSEKQLTLCEQLGVPLDDVMKKQKDLIHSFLGAALAQRDYQISDPEILDAIRFHTTGRANMSLLEKILIVADMTEPNRKPYYLLEEIRAAAFLDIDKAVMAGLKSKIFIAREKKKQVHPLSLEALAALEE